MNAAATPVRHRRLDHRAMAGRLCAAPGPRRCWPAPPRRTRPRTMPGSCGSTARRWRASWTNWRGCWRRRTATCRACRCMAVRVRTTSTSRAGRPPPAPAFARPTRMPAVRRLRTILIARPTWTSSPPAWWARVRRTARWQRVPARVHQRRIEFVSSTPPVGPSRNGRPPISRAPGEALLAGHAAAPDAPADNAWILRVDGQALARQLDELARLLAAADGDLSRLPLYGVPYAVRTTSTSRAGRPPPPARVRSARRAGVVRRLRAAGAILIGKTNLDQFATGLVGTRSPHGAVANAFRQYISGGSSSGLGFGGRARTGGVLAGHRHRLGTRAGGLQQHRRTQAHARLAQRRRRGAGLPRWTACRCSP